MTKVQPGFRRPHPRWARFIAVIAIGIALIGGGWFAASVFTSPEQRDAAAHAPQAQPILATAEADDLVDTRTLSGVVRATESMAATLLESDKGRRSVVTSVDIAHGDTVPVGKLVATVNGLPVFALQSPFPFYRDLGVGDRGVDVRALQDSLVVAGLLTASDGIYGANTAQAVSDLFANAGFVAPLRDLPAAPVDPAAPPTTATTPAGPAPQAAFFPMTAALTLSVLPALATSVPATGALVGADSTFTFSSPAMAVYATLPASLPEGLASGTAVVLNGGTVKNAPAKVVGTQAASDATTDGSPPPGSNNGSDPADSSRTATSAPEAKILADDPALLSSATGGLSVTVSVNVRTIATGALILPTAAVTEGATGQGSVLLLGKDRKFERVSVTILGSVGGRVAIQAGERLKAGDKVRIG